MAYPQASPITLTPRQQRILEQIVRRPTSCQGLVETYLGNYQGDK